MHGPIIDSSELEPAPPRRRWWGILWRVSGWLLSDPLLRRRKALYVEEGQLHWRICRAILYRAALVPPMLLLIAAALVYMRTHPIQPIVTLDPLSVGIYFEPVTILTEDHIRLDGWLAPALDARQVLAEGDKSLRDRWPAVVLVHGFGMSRQQVLPLFKPLHQRGFVVLAVALRGAGSLTAAGQTFGLNEATDIKAAVELLRRRSYVDGRRIAVVGVGSGANAALIAAERDPTLAALVLDAPADTGEQALDAHITRGPAALSWLDPLCRWVFAMGYGLDVRDLDLEQYGHVLASRPSLLMRWSADAESDLPIQRVDQIVDFLDNSLEPSREEADTGQK